MTDPGGGRRLIAGGVTSALGLLVCMVYILAFATVFSTVGGATVAGGPTHVPALPGPGANANSTVAALGQSFN